MSFLRESPASRIDRRQEIGGATFFLAEFNKVTRALTYFKRQAESANARARQSYVDTLCLDSRRMKVTTRGRAAHGTSGAIERIRASLTPLLRQCWKAWVVAVN